MSDWLTKDEMQERGWEIYSPIQFMNTITPDTVADIFRWNASGMTQREIPEHFHSEHGFTATSSCFNSLLKREGRFKAEHHLYSKVDAKDAEAVASRFFTKNKRRAKAVRKPCREELLYAALRAYEAWTAAEAAVMADGVSKENLRAWIDITREVEL